MLVDNCLLADRQPVRRLESIGAEKGIWGIQTNLLPYVAAD